MHVYRVTVRGQFKGLSDRSRAWLGASAAEHDIFLSAFTPEGTFTYDVHLRAFNLRYEVRLKDEHETTAEDPAAVATKEAELFLGTMGIGHGPLRAAVMDMNEMTARVDRQQQA